MVKLFLNQQSPLEMNRMARHLHAKSKNSLKQFLGDRRGVAALEFALVVPILITALFGLYELDQAIIAQRSVNHIAATVGDLTAQAAFVGDSDVSDMFAVGNYMLSPFPSDSLSMRITSIYMTTAKVAKVDWSKSSGASLPAIAPGTVFGTNGLGTYNIPSGYILKAGDSVILSEGQYNFNSPLQFVLNNIIKMSSSYIYRPRINSCVLYTPETVCPTN